MVSVYREFDRPLDHRALWDWHRMLMRERHRLNVIGGYRLRSEPMQVVSGSGDRLTVHYVAPPSDRMATEMDRFIAWYEHACAGEDRLSPLTCAGAVHLYFVFIHPFEDGNGRIGRALAEKALRLFRAEPDGFEGGLSAHNYRRITGSPASTATRDLADLVAKGALRRTGARRYTRYWLDLPSFGE